MGLFLLRFWPVLIPLFLYVLWILVARNTARKRGTPIPRFRDGPWFWAVIAALGLGVVMFLWIGLNHQSHIGEYTPPRFEDGKIIPGTVTP